MCCIKANYYKLFQVIDTLSAFEIICTNCMSLSATCYKFVSTTQTNTKWLQDIVEQLDSCLNATSDQLEQCGTLFVVLDSYISSTLYFDDEKTSMKKAYKKFLKLANLGTPEKEIQKPFIQIKNDLQKKLKITTKREKYEKEKYVPPRKYTKRTFPYIHTAEMLYDRNDRTNIQCKECMKVYMSLSNLRNHYVRVHAPKDFKCPTCSRGFGSQSYLEAHMEESHISLVCSECGKTFGNKHTLRMHKRTHYLRFVCQDCGRVYKNATTFKQHITNNICQSVIRKSQADAQFTCDYCQKRYSQKMTLRVHIQHEHLDYENFECKWCKKKFTCQSRLKAHIVKHTGEKNFPCSVCDGKFVTKESLLYHTRTHTGEKPYKCPHCDLRFLSASRRASHIRSQHTDATEECDICHSKFRSHTYLQRHKKLHLGDKIVKEQPRNKLQVLSNNAHRKMHSRTEDFVLMPLNGKPVVVTKEDFNTIAVGDMSEYTKDGEEFQYDASEGDSQTGNEELYFEVSDGNDYIMKVSENVEV